MEISNVSDKDFKIMNVKRLSRMERRVEELTENFNKETSNIEKNQ